MATKAERTKGITGDRGWHGLLLSCMLFWLTACSVVSGEFAPTPTKTSTATPTTTPTPTPTPIPRVIEFDLIKPQWSDYKAVIRGRVVEGWYGWVEAISTKSGETAISIDLDAPNVIFSDSEIFVVVSNSAAKGFADGDRVRFFGIVSDADKGLFSGVSLWLRDVRIERAEIRTATKTPTTTPTVTSTPTATATPTPILTVIPFAQIAPRWESVKGEIVSKKVDSWYGWVSAKSTSASGTEVEIDLDTNLWFSDTEIAFRISQSDAQSIEIGYRVVFSGIISMANKRTISGVTLWLDDASIAWADAPTATATRTSSPTATTAPTRTPLPSATATATATSTATPTPTITTRPTVTLPPELYTATSAAFNATSTRLHQILTATAQQEAYAFSATVTREAYKYSTTATRAAYNSNATATRAWRMTQQWLTGTATPPVPPTAIPEPTATALPTPTATELPAATPEPAPVAPVAPSTGSGGDTNGDIKLSENMICHEPGGRYYDRTTNYISKQSMADCCKAGGRPPKYTNKLCSDYP